MKKKKQNNNYKERTLLCSVGEKEEREIQKEG